MTSRTSPLVGESEPMRRLRALIATIAPTRLSVLIEGATGTGKELVAAHLHEASGRNGALVAFNVCALGESMFEDALFGHVRGAYTGAVGESLGLLREANGGTAFFDEISGLPPGLQAKLLRAIETGVFRPIGAARDAQSDFRVVAATNERIGGLVSEGRFRADLGHRLSGIVLAVPSLAERVEDIPMLVAHFVQRADSSRTANVTPAALRLLQERDWPGNIRELKQVIDAAIAFSGAGLDADAVRMALAHRSVPSSAPVHDTFIYERHQLSEALKRCAWDTEQTAVALGINRATVYRRIKRLGIALPRFAFVRANSRREGAKPANEA